jgi:molybdopterin-guanine dinucleotide biosynthesis protein A
MNAEGHSPASGPGRRDAGAGRTAAILSGGAGTRIGSREKGLLPFGDTTFIEKKIVDLAGVFDSILIVTARPGKYAYLESGSADCPGGGGKAALERVKASRVRVIEDLVEGLGALGAIYTALRAVADEAGPVFVTTSDTPFLLPELARALFDGALERGFDVFIPTWSGMIEPLCGVYSRRCIPAIEEILPDRKIRLFYPRVRTGYLPEARVREIDPEGKSFININTEEDYRRYIGGAL